MQYSGKIFLISLLSIFICIFFIENSFAQPRGMTMSQVNQQTGRWAMNQQIQFMTQMQMANMNWRQFAGRGEKYYVTFKDSTTKQIASFMYYDTLQRKNFLVMVNKKFPKSDSVHRIQTIYPYQTLNLSFGEEKWKKNGIPTDSGWTFKVVTGAIKVYAKSMDYYMITKTPAFSAEIPDFVPSAIIGIQLNDGSMEILTKETVLKMVSLDVKAVELLEKDGMYMAIARYNRDVEKNARKTSPGSED